MNPKTSEDAPPEKNEINESDELDLVTNWMLHRCSRRKLTKVIQGGRNRTSPLRNTSTWRPIRRGEAPLHSVKRRKYKTTNSKKDNIRGRTSKKLTLSKSLLLIRKATRNKKSVATENAVTVCDEVVPNEEALIATKKAGGVLCAAIKTHFSSLYGMASPGERRTKPPRNWHSTNCEKKGDATLV